MKEGIKKKKTIILTFLRIFWLPREMTGDSQENLVNAFIENSAQVRLPISQTQVVNMH